MLDAVRAKRNRNNRNRGKLYERDVAERIGGKRYPANVGGPCDVDHPLFAVQVKSGGAVVTEVIRQGMNAAELAAVIANKLPLLVVVDRRGTRLKRYAIMPLEAFVDLHGLGIVEVVDAELKG